MGISADPLAELMIFWTAEHVHLGVKLVVCKWFANLKKNSFVQSVVPWICLDSADAVCQHVLAFHPIWNDSDVFGLTPK
jgi:hypothetical protein